MLATHVVFRLKVEWGDHGLATRECWRRGSGH